MSVSNDEYSDGVMSRVRYRRPLNSEQILVLEWLYKYRFSASRQLAIALHKPSHKTIQNKLQILEEQGLIGKRYDKSYKLAGRAAEYYLTPRGARTLTSYYGSLPKDSPDRRSLNESIVKSFYKNKTVSDAFIAHCLSVVDMHHTLKQLYGDKLRIYPQAILADYAQFPTWRPDLYLSLKTPESSQIYMLDIWDDTRPFFVSVRKMRNYLNHQESDDWVVDGQEYPYILAVCKDDKTQKKLNRQIIKALNENYISDEISYATTTIDQLQKVTKPTDKLWSKVDPDDELEKLSLRNLYS